MIGIRKKFLILNLVKHQLLRISNRKTGRLKQLFGFCDEEINKLD